MSPFLRQLWTVFAVWLSAFSQGVVISYQSTLLPALIAEDAEIKTDLETAVWIASSVGIGIIPGQFLPAILMDQYGRRITFAVINIPGIIGWLLIYFAHNTTNLAVGRIFCGMTNGALFIFGGVIIGEYSNPKHRGMFINIKTAFYSIGAICLHIADNYLSWKSTALLAVVPYIIILILVMTWPESPAWLATRRDFEKSKEIFLWLRGNGENSKEELRRMLEVQMARPENLEIMTFNQRLKHFLKIFTRKDVFKPIFIIFLGGFLFEVSGRHVFPANAINIVEQITRSKSNSFYITLALDLSIATSATFSAFLIRVMKRRFLLFSTGLLSVAVLAIACTYLYLVSIEFISKEYPWVPIGLFFLFFIFANLGCTPMPVVFLGELMPLAHRGIGLAVGCTLMAIPLNLILYLTPLFLVYFKVYGTFAIFGATLALLLLILYFIMPETKDKTLQEIEEYFNGVKYEDNDDGAQMKMMNDTDFKM